MKTKPICRTFKNGSRRWNLNKNLHREDGPALENPNGDQSWWISGKLHREDGPAIELAYGPKIYYLNDRCFSEETFKCLTQKK